MVSFNIVPVATPPTLHVRPEVFCLYPNATNASFLIDAALVDTDGSEDLVIHYNIPEEWKGSVGEEFQGSYSLISENVKEELNITISALDGFLYPVEIPVVAMSIEKTNADQKMVYTKVKIAVCNGMPFQPRKSSFLLAGQE